MNEKKIMSYMYITVISAVVILVAIAFQGTYSFFVANIEKQGEDATTNIQAGGIANVTITGATEIEPITNMIPDDRYDYTFTLTNNDDFEATGIKLVWKDVVNEFTNKKDLIYTLTNTTTGAELITEEQSKRFPSLDDEEIISDLTLNASTSNNYKLTIIYVNDLENNQMIDEEGNPLDMGKSFGASIEIEHQI